MYFVSGVYYSFDWFMFLESIFEVKIFLVVLMVYIVDNGVFIYLLQFELDLVLMDCDLMVYGLKVGFGKIGVWLGSQMLDELKFFWEEMLLFWRMVLGI